MLTLKGQRSFRRGPEYDCAILGKEGEYLPLFSLDIPKNPALGRRPTSNRFNSLVRNKAIEEGAPPFARITADKFLNVGSSGTGGIQQATEMKAFCERMPLALQAFTKKAVKVAQLERPSERRYRSYDNLFEGLNNFDWRVVRNSTHAFLVTYGACFEIIQSTGEDPSFKPLFITVAPRKYSEYLKMCWLVGKEPNKAILEVWESPDFDVKNSAYKYLRSQYLKRIKKPLLEEGFTSFVMKGDILKELYATIELPSDIQTIGARTEWVKEASKEALEHLRHQRNLNNTRVEVTL